MTRMDAGGYAACFDHQQLALMCANSDRTIDRLGVENNKLKAENAKLREFASEAFSMAFNFYHGSGTAEDLRELTVEYRELGIEVIP